MKKKKLICPKLSYRIIGLLHNKVHNELGWAYKEKYYQRAIENELKNQKINFKRELPVDIYYDQSPIGKYYVDFLIDEKIVLETKTVPDINKSHVKQVLAYLNSLKKKLGIIANFRARSLTFKRVINIGLACLLWFIFFFAIISVNSRALANQLSLSISPPLLEVMIQPGKSITKAYEVTNNSNRDLYLNAKLVPFTPADHFGNISLNLDHTLREVHSEHLGSATSFFSLQNNNISLNQPFRITAGGKQQLVLKINIPPENQEKDYYYTFLIEQIDRGEYIPSTSGSSHRIKIGSNILLTVSESGQPKTDFQISEFRANPKFGDIFDTVKFKLLIENTGQAFFKPEGKIVIYNTLFNKKMAELDLLPENILVNSVREIRCSSSTSAEENLAQEKTSEAGELSEKENLKISECTFSSWLPGKYKAVIGTSSHQAQTSNPQSLAYFYLIPYRLILTLLIIILITWQIRQKQILDRGLNNGL